MIQDPIEDRGGDHRSANTVPHSATRRFDVISMKRFVAAADQLGERVRRAELHRRVAEFIDDPRLWLRQREQFRVQAPLAMRLGEASDQRRRRGELHRVTDQERVSPVRCRQVALAAACGPSSSTFSPCRSSVTRQGRGSASERSTAVLKVESRKLLHGRKVCEFHAIRCGVDSCARSRTRTAGSASHAPQVRARRFVELVADACARAWRLADR